jgi:pimeloyl-ACP methyl ester carboxylesterase
MPGDLLRNSDRWGMAYLHNGVIQTGLSNVGNIGLNLSLNRVSDDDYWRDFPRGTTSLTQRLLASDASLTWGKGYFSTTLRALKWQTLQDVTSPITPPYDRLPQITAPTLVLYGEEDVICPPRHSRQIASLIPGAELLGVPAQAHQPFQEGPESFNRIVLDFLANQ